MDWRPIDQVWESGWANVAVDLWINNGEVGYREADCRWDEHAKPDGCWANSEGRMYHTGDMATHFMIIEPPKQNGE